MKSKLFATIFALTILFSSVAYAKDFYYRITTEEEMERFNEASKFANQGSKLAAQLKYAEALVCYAKAIKTVSDYPPFWSERGEAFSRNGQYQEAIIDFTEAVYIIDARAADEKEPNNDGYLPFGYEVGYDLDLFFDRAMAYHCLGNEEACINDLKTAARDGSKAAKSALWAKGILWSSSRF